jgi:hypothetical protein
MILFLISGFLKCAQADTITLYFEFELEKNEELYCRINQKFRYQSPAGARYIFDSIKVEVDSGGILPHTELFIYKKTLIAGKHIPVSFFLQTLKGYKYILIKHRPLKCKHKLAYVVYLSEPLPRGFTIHCGLQRFWRIRNFFR